MISCILLVNDIIYSEMHIFIHMNTRHQELLTQPIHRVHIICDSYILIVLVLILYWLLNISDIIFFALMYMGFELVSLLHL